MTIVYNQIPSGISWSLPHKLAILYDLSYKNISEKELEIYF